MAEAHGVWGGLCDVYARCIKFMAVRRVTVVCGRCKLVCSSISKTLPWFLVSAVMLSQVNSAFGTNLHFVDVRVFAPKPQENVCILTQNIPISMLTPCQ